MNPGNVDILKFIQDNIFLVGVAFVSGAMLVWPMVRRGTTGPAVNTTEAVRLMNHQDAIVVDVREPAEYAVKLDDYNLEQAQRAVVARAIDKHQGNISQAASELGLTRASLYRRIQKYGL